MSYMLPPLNWLRSFEAAARLSSFTHAARELSFTQPAVSYHIRSLEAHLGVTLFERYARSIELTDIGRAYIPAVRQAFTQLSTATGGIFGTGAGTTISVRSTASFAISWLAPRLEKFLKANPKINVRLYTAIWTDALGDEHTDIEVRHGDGHWNGYDTIKLGAEDSIVVCSPDSADLLGEKPEVAHFVHEDLVRIMGCENLWALWFQAAGIEDASYEGGILVDNSLAALEIAASGYGHALVLRSLAEPYLVSGRLVAPVTHCIKAENSHYLLVPERSTPMRPEVLLFRDWLLDEMRSA